jgi:AcrR family transcriptional regulator
LTDGSPPLSSYRLPRGRHGLPREHVEESQRWRLIAAAGEVLAEQGFAKTKSADIASRAGVSRSTFYGQFENVEACLLAAYEMASACILELASAACEADEAPERRLRLAIDTTLAFLAEDATMVKLLGSESAAGVPAIAIAHERLVAQLGDMLRAVRSGSPDPDDGTAVERRLVGGAFALVSDTVAAESARRLPELAPQLTELLALRFQPA